MNGNDIFNTINEIDAKLITDAWENTEPYYPMSMRQDSGKAAKLKAFGAAAAFAAVICVTAAIVFIRSSTVPTLPSQSSPGVSFVDTATIYGPDHNPIPENYKIISGSMDSASDEEELVVCYDCVYLAEAFGGNFNSIDNPRIFPEDLSEPYFRDTKSVYRLYNVGDKFGDLTVSKAQVSFKKTDGTSAGEIVRSYVQLDGTITLKAYILLNQVAEINRKIICVPMLGEKSLPIITAILDPESGNYVSRRYYAQYLSGNFKCSTELPSRILLHTFGITVPDDALSFFSDKWDMNDEFLDRKITKLLTEGNGYAAVTLELSNIYMSYSPDGSSITANIETISRYEPYTGDLPFELYGPDHKQLKYEDISEVTTVNGYKVSFDEISDSTVTNIKCKDFTYFRLPGSDEFKRYDTLDDVNGMRILSASSTLSTRKSQDSYYTGGEAILWGSVTMQTTMLTVNGQIYIANTLIPTTVDDCVFTITTGTENSYMSSCTIVSESEFERLASLPGGVITTPVMVRISSVNITDNGKTVNVTLRD